jgi:hypothetical protein
VRRKNFVPSDSAVLCSRHFREEDIDRTSVSTVRIRENAVPSIFPAFPTYLQKPKRTRKPPVERLPPLSGQSVTPAPAAWVSVSDETPRSTAEQLPPLESFVAANMECSSMLVNADHCYGTVPDTPRKAALKRKLSRVQQQLTSSRKKVKVLLQAKRRLIKRNANLKDVITDLRKHNLLGSDSLSILEKTAGGVGDLIKRLAIKQLGKPMPASYSPELRSFALTLHFYSPHAYRYVRRVFNTCLPHPRTIEKWYTSVDGQPGFTDHALRALQARAASRQTPLICSLMMDEVAIRQQLEWDGKKFCGYIDMGTGTDDDSLPIAKEALVFMVVAVNDCFKLPVGYFLIDGLGALERANLVNQCLTKLHDVGINVIALTFDGASSNIAMANNLGCNLDVDDVNFSTFFRHPVSDEPVVIFFDPCHMLKLIRNTLADKKSLVDDENKFVDFEFINKLHKLQDSEGLHLGNRLRSAHMAWYKKKMNVKLAAQLLSESVALSLEFCVQEKMPEFKGCEATVKFIRYFDRLFDVFNSRNLKANAYKRPLQASNWTEVAAFLSTARAYIVSLKESPKGKSMVKSNRKTGFLGFVVCIDSICKLYNSLIVANKMSFICTYKFSQDHLELLFGKIRSLGGCNNNPSARQFCAAYKKLLVHNEIQDVIRGNCLPLQEVPILTVSSSTASSDPPAVVSINQSSVRSRLVDRQDFRSDHDYTYIPDRGHLSACSEKIVVYIAGFVVFKLKNALQCEKCVAVLFGTDDNQYCSLIKMKTQGGLIFPSRDVIEICLTCEKFFRRVVYSADSSTLSRVSCHEIVQCVLEVYLNKDIFVSLADHMLECDPLSNHMILLIKAVAEKYLQVRYYYAGRHFSAKQIEKRQKISRQVSNKLVLFSGL